MPRPRLAALIPALAIFACTGSDPVPVSSPVPDAGEPGPPGQVDAGTDVVVVPTTGYCKAEHPDAIFCQDFDGPDAERVLREAEMASTSTPTLVSKGAVSGTSAARFALASGSVTNARAYVVAPTTAKRLRIGFDMTIELLEEGDAAQHRLRFLTIARGKDAFELRHQCNVEDLQDRCSWTLKEDHGNGSSPRHDFSKPETGVPHRIVIESELRNGGEWSLTIDEQTIFPPLTFAAGDDPLTPTTTVRFGLEVLEGPIGPTSTIIDNLLVESL